MSHEAALQEEVAFWQALIDRQGNEVPAEVLERMRQARELATQRLAQVEANLRPTH